MSRPTGGLKPAGYCSLSFGSQREVENDGCADEEEEGDRGGFERHLLRILIEPKHPLAVLVVGNEIGAGRRERAEHDADEEKEAAQPWPFSGPPAPSQ